MVATELLNLAMETDEERKARLKKMVAWKLSFSLLVHSFFYVAVELSQIFLYKDIFKRKSNFNHMKVIGNTCSIGIPGLSNA